MTSLPNSPAARDIANLLHPYTDARRHAEVGPIVIECGEGIHVFDDAGNRYVEAMSGLWSVAVGFGERRLAEAAARQLAKLPFYHSFSGKSNNPAIDLGERLVAMSPPRLRHAFFTNSGSEANDTVVKMVWYANNARGLPKKKTFIARKKGYHGVTIASASLTGLPINHTDFDLPAIPVRHLTCPHFYRFGNPGESEAAFVDRLADELEAVIAAEGAETIAAFIGEPLMGAGGVIPPPAGYWQRMQAICRRHDILVVADEVINGFGRLGTTFGSERYGIDPDILVCSKQLTSSYVPLAAVLISDPIFHAIADNSARLRSFGHGYTTTGHPVACAVAMENLDIIAERGLVANAAAMGALLHRELAPLAEHPLVGEVRGTGLIAGIELVADKATRATFDPPGIVGAEVFARAHGHGLIVRAIGDTIALCPPLIVSEADVRDIVERLSATLNDVTDWVRERGLARTA
ncbi:putative aminotransferase y4uB [Beijerinckiaceae bacterium RH AL1]|nr:aspartate aminotransferase family protein [Beijerinckiaceae bacterium]VVB49342.1 putative aminotransferase y4uB [Beijerinckiaceae bacterium RH CH11]VVB49422.1 putative aminotransferase y4uB [Beijerinckiaceae bacterium RH AL8]VVC56853.1 putative aminotransferase y4uB [Beijerinckiaceae bacterium RH AL1]